MLRLRSLSAHLRSPAPAEAAAAPAVDAEPIIPRLSAAASPAEIAETLGAHGVVVVENLVEPSHMQRVEDELADKDIFYGEQGSFARSDTSRNAGKALGESAAVQELAVNPSVVAAVQERLLPWCKKVVLGTCSAITVEPPPPGEDAADHQVLHRDDGMWAASSWPVAEPRPDLSVSCMWAVTDFTQGNVSPRTPRPIWIWPVLRSVLSLGRVRRE